MQTTLGTTVGAFSAQAVWRLTGQFAVNPVPENNYQSEVKSFSTVDLAFQYAPASIGGVRDVSLSLNIDNVLGTNPPADLGTSSGGYGYFGFTLGRYIELGLKKKF